MELVLFGFRSLDQGSDGLATSPSNVINFCSGSKVPVRGAFDPNLESAKQQKQLTRNPTFELGLPVLKVFLSWPTRTQHSRVKPHSASTMFSRCSGKSISGYEPAKRTPAPMRGPPIYLSETSGFLPQK